MSNPNQYFCFQFFFLFKSIVICSFNIYIFYFKLSINFYFVLSQLGCFNYCFGTKGPQTETAKEESECKIFSLQFTDNGWETKFYLYKTFSIQLEYLSNFQLSVYKHNSILTIVIWNDRIALLWPFSSNFDPLHFAICGSENQNVFPSSISSWCHIVNNTIASSPDNSDNCSLCSKYRVFQNSRATLFFPIFVSLPKLMQNTKVGDALKTPGNLLQTWILKVDTDLAEMIGVNCGTPCIHHPPTGRGHGAR